MKKQSHNTKVPAIELLEDRKLMSTTVLFSDNFEAGNKGWSVDTALGIDYRNPWTIGNVNGGPRVAHSGTKVAATTNPGDDAYLASPVISLPSVNQYSDHLYLKWSQWTNYSANGGFGASIPTVRTYEPDLGGWGPWNVIDPNTEPVPQVSKTWGTVSLDLTQFAGSKVQIGFHNYGMRNGAPGWYIDDVEINRTSIQKPWAADTKFEAGFNGWSTTGGMWDIGAATGITSPGGGKLAGTGLTTTPVAGQTSSLISPAFYLPKNTAGQPVTLQFNSFTDKASSTLMMVEWQYWMPSTGWSPVQNFSADGVEVLTGYQPGGRWTTFKIPVTQSLGGAYILPVRILFTASAGMQNARGWFIDDVSLNFAGKTTTPVIPTPTPTPAPHTVVGGSTVNFGSQKVGMAGKDMVFIVRNTTKTTMTLGSITLASNNGFTVLQQPAKTVVAGGSTTFKIRMNAAVKGHHSAKVVFALINGKANPLNFTVIGDVVA